MTPAPRRWSLPALAVVALLAAGVLGWTRWTGDAPVATRSPYPSADGADAAPVHANGGSGLAAHPAAVRVEPLPAQDRPFAETREELERRAREGESRAACRLAAEHMRCLQVAHRTALLAEHIGGQQAAIERIEEPTARATAQSAFTRHLASQEAELESMGRHCDGVTPASPDELVAHWRRAAHAGHLPALRQYASGNAFRWREMLDQLPALAQYRVEAETLARRGAAAGDAQLIAALASAYAGRNDMPHRTLLQQAVAPDRIEAIALLTHLDAAVAPRMREPAPRSGLSAWREALVADATAEELAEAERRAADYAARWSRPDLSSVAISTAGPRQGAVPDVAPVDCESEVFAAR